MFGLLLKLSGPVRNSLAMVLSLATLGLLFYTWVTPVWSAWLYAHWAVMVVIVPAWIQVVTKLTTWKGDDSLGAWLWKQIKAGH